MDFFRAMKECYYNILGVDKKAADDVIKKAYRQLALKHHPDKHAEEKRDEATVRFQLIVEAYEVLSNSQERAWYDSHREQILRGGDSDESGGGAFRTKKDIFQYFSSSCYGNRHDDREGGFYKVYADFFEEISRLERDDSFDACSSSSSDSDDNAHDQVYPSFGDSRTEWDDVLRFYSIWGNFATCRYFGSFDKWDIREGENRQVRRAMEAENKKSRAAARKEFSLEIRNLVAFVKRRDKRMIEYLARQSLLEREAKELKERQTKEKEEARQRARVTAREEEMKRWEEVEAARIAAGELDSSSSSNSEDPKEEFVCIACRKSFKSEKAFVNHEQSKKHKQEILRLREELMLSSDDEPVVEHHIPSPAVTKKSKKKKPTLSTSLPSPEVVTSEPTTLTVSKERKPRRRRKEKPDPNTFGACQVCGEKFGSKTALFKHLDAAGHHAPKA